MQEEGQNKTQREVQQTPPIRSEEEGVCKVCKVAQKKYRCPACLIPYCSVRCCKEHKVVDSCTGKRPASVFVPLSGMNDNTLITDYRFLEETKRATERTSRQLQQPNHAYTPYSLSRRWERLLNAAEERKVSLLFMPKGMSRRNVNKSWLNFKENVVSWTVEWQFPSVDLNLFDESLNENEKLVEALKKHLQDPLVSFRLKSFVDFSLPSCLFLLKAEGYPANQKVYYQVSPQSTLKKVLRKKKIVEFPSFVISLPSDAAKYSIIPDKPKKVKEGKEEKEKEKEKEKEIIENARHTTYPEKMAMKKNCTENNDQCERKLNEYENEGGDGEEESGEEAPLRVSQTDIKLALLADLSS